MVIPLKRNRSLQNTEFHVPRDVILQDYLPELSED